MNDLCEAEVIIKDRIKEDKAKGYVYVHGETL